MEIKKVFQLKSNIKTPSLSVVMPVFNEEKTIEKIFNKVYKNELVSEIIITLLHTKKHRLLRHSCFQVYQEVGKNN